MITLDGATNCKGASVLNLMAGNPQAFFIKHVNMNLCKETAQNVAAKIIEGRLHITERLMSDKDISELKRLRDDAKTTNNTSSVESFLEAAMKKRFWSFISDSCNAMIAVRKCLSERTFCTITRGANADVLRSCFAVWNRF